jgi:hypothetical protein
MMSTSKPNSPSLRFLLIGGWTAVKSAIMGSLLAVFITNIFIGIYSVWQNGLQTIEFNNFGFQTLLSSIALMLLLAILFTVFPAFLGGIVLAWLLNRKDFITSDSNPGGSNLGAWIGASAGVGLALLFLIPADFVGRTAHGGIGYNFLESVPIYIFYAIQSIAIATMAGIWTDRQLRKYLESARPANTG